MIHININFKVGPYIEQSYRYVSLLLKLKKKSNRKVRGNLVTFMTKTTTANIIIEGIKHQLSEEIRKAQFFSIQIDMT